MDKTARTLKRWQTGSQIGDSLLNAQRWEMIRRDPSVQSWEGWEHGNTDGLKPLRVPAELSCVALASLLSRV